MCLIHWSTAALVSEAGGSACKLLLVHDYGMKVCHCTVCFQFAHLLPWLVTAAMPHSQVDTPWRKAMTKLEGDPAFEALDKIDRLEVFQEYIK